MTFVVNEQILQKVSEMVQWYRAEQKLGRMGRAIAKPIIRPTISRFP
jgi:hypothetical protein